MLPAFIEAKRETKKPELDERDKDLLDLRQQMEMLRRDMRPGRIREGERSREIGAEEARVIIRDYVTRGMSVADIVRRVAPLGPPPRWIAQEVAQLEGKGPEPAAASEPPKESGSA